jgi:uncharacterized phage protein (predicted DNA packaging)|uniref:Head tail connector n=1 Tax=Siphoviridae sp. ctVqj4 TaxID=2826359 RepID=A0A8S5NLF3_9CAUD|nr:MAG TPA: head tail connector [Siphoviridae sp. ctVqj4]
MDLNDIKTYLYIDTDDEDALISSLKLSAEKYLKNAGIAVDYENQLYCTAIKMLVANWYDVRDSINGKDTMSIMFKSIVSQLVLSGGKK